LNFNYINFN